MRDPVDDLLDGLGGLGGLGGLVLRGFVDVVRGEQAVANARTAVTELSRRRVERAQVDLFLAAGLPHRRGGRDTA